MKKQILIALLLTPLGFIFAAIQQGQAPGKTIPSGTSGQLQYNNGGAFGGTTGVTYNSSSSTLEGKIAAPAGAVSEPSIKFATATVNGFYMNEAAPSGKSSISSSVDGHEVMRLRYDNGFSNGQILSATYGSAARPAFSNVLNPADGLYFLSVQAPGISAGGAAVQWWDGDMRWSVLESGVQSVAQSDTKARPAYSYYSDNTTGMFRVGSSTIGFTGGGTEIMRLGPGGVAIATGTISSTLTVQGVIESRTGGFKFPDGTTQTTAASGATLSGSGTSGKVTKWTGTSSFGDSVIQDNGTDVTIPSGSKLYVNGGNSTTPTIVNSYASNYGISLDNGLVRIIRGGAQSAIIDGSGYDRCYNAGSASIPVFRVNESSDNGAGMFSVGTGFLNFSSDGLERLQVRKTAALQTKNGTNTTYAQVVSRVYASTTTKDNTSTGETDLMTYSLGGGTLANDKDSIAVRGYGNVAANANNKTIKVYFGSTVIYNSGAIAMNNSVWNFDCEVTRTGATAQVAGCRVNGSDTLLKADASYATAAETLSGAVTIKVTGQGGATSDISQKFMAVDVKPGS